MIGIFDSGVGGMTVMRAVEQRLPDIPIIYLGDLARTPYGSKSARAIISYSVENTAFLLEKGAELIVIACNSAASTPLETLRQEFSVPIIEVITPAAQQAAQLTRSGRIGVIGTSATVRSGVYARLITGGNPNFKVYSQPCPLLVPLVEEGWLARRETKMIVKRYLHPLRQKQIDTLILGCTHYPLLKDLIQPRIGTRVRLIDSSLAVAEHVGAFLAENPNLCRARGPSPTRTHYVTDVTEAAQRTANTIFQRTITLQPA